jgi:hypothetical protein
MPSSKLFMVALQSALLVLILSCCKHGDDGEQTPPVLSVTPVSLSGPYQPATKSFGEISFRDNRAFIPFAGLLTATTLNPGFEYYTTADALVRASCGGEIVYMFKNDGIDDWEIHIKSSPETNWSVQHDHVSDPVVRQGDRVNAGDVMGGTGRWNQALGIGRTELCVIYAEGPGTDMCHCPIDFGTAGFVQAHNGLLAALNAQGFGSLASLCLAATVKT